MRAIADMQVGDGNQGAAVGTTIALLERGSRVMSAIHKRCYAAYERMSLDCLSKSSITISYHQNILMMLLVVQEILNKQTLMIE